MHLVCLGVVKKLILLWHIGPNSVKLSNRMKQIISDALISLRNIQCLLSAIEDRDL